MNKILSVFIFLVIGTFSSYSQQAEHVIIISIDGFRPDFYMDPSWGMVNLRQLKEEGVSARSVNSNFPTVTFVNHTTIITGERPVDHGILYNYPFVPKGQNSEWHWYAKDIKATTLWEAVKAKGMSTAAVNWPVSVGGAIDYNIPIIKENGVPQLEVISKNSMPQGFFEEVQEFATGIMEAEDFVVQKNLTIMDSNVGRISSYIIRKYKPALLSLRLSSVDHFQHLTGRDSKMVRTAVAGTDHAIRDILQAIDRAGLQEKTAIIITGDHGFVNTHTSLSPNLWLKENGLYTDNENWKAQFHTVGGSAFLMLKDPNDSKTVSKITSILNDLPEAQKKLFKKIDRQTMDSLGVDPKPAFGLLAVPGIVFKNSTTGSIIGTHRRGTHGYYSSLPQMKTGFVAYGAGIRKGLEIDNMGLEDIAPLVSELLSLDLNPKAGVLLKGLLQTKENH